ncbi:hypothetical protein DFH08DRAFT_664468, partial [Mycena albidolilacea]
ISTLNLAFLVPSDHLDLSRRKFPQIFFAKRRAQTQLNYEQLKKTSLSPFPPACTGFLHYYRDQGTAPLEGSVRFRVISWNAPSSFQHDYDLLSPSGLPWQVTL